DFANRTVGPAGAARQPDAPAAGGVQLRAVPPAAGDDRNGVEVTAGGNVVTCRLEPGAVPTATAYLPANPAWRPGLGPLVAVGHTEPVNATTLVTLFDGT